MKKFRTVVIGGGNGGASSVNALKQNLDICDIAAVISMSDSGGSSGKLREEFDTVPPGDVMRVVLAMSPYDYKILKKIFYTNRFQDNNTLDGHNLGNLFLTFTGEYAGDFMKAVRALEQVVDAVGHVYPTTLDKTHLVASLDNGEQVRGETHIDKPTYDRKHKITKVWLEPAGMVFNEAAASIRDAEYIVFGPGDLHTSIIAAILPTGLHEAIAESQAKLIYVVGNKYSIDGETGPTELSQFVSTLETYLPRSLDTIIYNTSQLSKTQAQYYAEKGWGLITLDPEKIRGKQVIGEMFERPEGGLSFPDLGRILRNIIAPKKMDDTSNHNSLTTIPA